MNPCYLTQFTLLFAVNFACLAATEKLDLPDAKVTVRVLDQDDQPVPSAAICVAGDPAGLEKQPETFKEGASNQGGIWEVQLKSRGEISVGVKKDGYYSSEGVTYDYRAIPNELNRALERKRWEPWNPRLEVMLKRVINPRPLYAKHVEAKIPEDASPVGFDLEAGDWVAPYGKGSVNDFIFTIDRTITSGRDYLATLRLRFSNKADGIVAEHDARNRASALLLKHFAPESEYESERTWNVGRLPTGSGPDIFSKPSTVIGYYFRVRTILDDNGKVKSTVYGKIREELRLYAGTKAPKAGIGFTYYLNPTPNDRNVEFDPKRNLFTGLKGLEAVSAP
jgi:hypothetical protein